MSNFFISPTFCVFLLQPKVIIKIKHEKECFIRISKHRDVGRKKEAQPSFLITDFEVFGYLMKRSFEFLKWLLKPFTVLGEIQRKSSQNFIQKNCIQTTVRWWRFPLFSLYELLMNLRSCLSAHIQCVLVE